MIRPEHLQRLLALALFVFAAMYLGRGMYRLAVVPEAAGDLLMRNQDQRYVYGGQNPYDVLARTQAEKRGLPPPKVARNDRPRADIPELLAGGMPPWAFPEMVPLVLPWFELGRYWYTFLHALLLGWLGYWAYRTAQPFGASAGLLACASMLAINAHSTTVALGNLGVVVLALLALVLRYEQLDRPLPAGLALAAAAVKPTLSGPFFTSLFVRGRIRTLLAAAATLVVLSLICWPMTHTHPLEMLQQMGRAGMQFMDNGYGLLNVVMALGVPVSLATPSVALGIALLHLALAWRLRERSLLVQFAIAGVAARLWSYHARHDNLILAFLLIALLISACRRPSLWTWSLFAAVGISLWLPARSADYLAFRVYQHFVWIAGTCGLLLRDADVLEASTPKSNQALRAAVSDSRAAQRWS